MPVPHPLIAVVDANLAGVIVWWVAAESEPRASRMCSAWTVAPGDTETLDNLLARQVGLATSAGALALKVAHVPPRPLIDAAATLARITGEMATLETAFAATQAKRKASHQLVPPHWPTLPPPIDLESPPRIDAPEDVHNALSIARWLDALCERWSDLEDIRIARPALHDLGGPASRPVPLVLTPTS
jgi:hypothetical protein